MIDMRKELFRTCVVDGIISLANIFTGRSVSCFAHKPNQSSYHSTILSIGTPKKAATLAPIS